MVVLGGEGDDNDVVILLVVVVANNNTIVVVVATAGDYDNAGIVVVAAVWNCFTMCPVICNLY